MRLVAAATVGGLGATSAREGAATSPPGSSDDALDEALRLLRETGAETRQGLSSHAPMVAEVLCGQGHGERALQWVRAFRGPVLRLPPPRAKIPRGDWRSALGPRSGAASWEQSLERWADWHELFTAELAEGSWRVALDTWVGRLAPGLCAAATHGIIRTAHAARGLARRESKDRRDELARGLAYWASAYQELPARAAAPAVSRGGYSQALERVPLYSDTHDRAPAGNIVSGLREAGALAGFDEVRDLVPAPADVSMALSDLIRTATLAYLRHGTQGRTVATIAFVHGVTGPAALRRLAPYVRPETAAAAMPWAWQAVAGIYAAYARRDNPTREPRPRSTHDELIARAMDNGDEHAIKFTESLLAEHALRPDDAFLAAAEDVVTRL
jgi:hypothetical protein